MKIKIITLLFFVSIFSFAQQKELDIGFDVVSTTKGVFGYPSLGIQFSPKTKLKIGILIGQEYVNSNTIFGAQTDFLFFPNGNNQQNFNLFFVSSLNYFYDKVSLNFSEVKSNNIQLTIGYGFNYSLSERLALQTQMGIGGLVSFRSFNFNTTDPTTQGNFAGIISIGVNYQL